MITWVLFIIVLEADRYYVQANSFYSTMDKCFEARDVFMASAPQPKINYEAVCVQTNRIETR